MVSKVHLVDFRNFKKRDFEFSSNTSVLIGPNGVGKTNVLESIFLLSTGKSFKAKVEEEMISYENDIARVKGWVVRSGEGLGDKVGLETVLTKGLIDVGSQRLEKVARKKLIVNGVSKRLVDFAGNLRVVLFGPWELSIVTESPSIRRKFLDTVLSQVDREYRRAILSYEKGLRQRNKLLYRIREEGLSRGQLLFWNKLLIKNGDYISNARQRLIDFINRSPSLNEEQFSLEYDKSAISPSRLEQYAQEEVAAATTLVGPHRDDFVFKVRKESKTRELASFGSRGEQRMGVLWLKLSEIAFVETEVGEKPTLLLDDIFSELDHEHRKIVMKVIEDYQTIITTADPHFVESFKKVEIIDLNK